MTVAATLESADVAAPQMITLVSLLRLARKSAGRVLLPFADQQKPVNAPVLIDFSLQGIELP